MAKVKRNEWSCGGMAWDWCDDVPTCDHCGASAEETDLSSTAHSGGVICGEIGCWNDYMMSNVFNDFITPTEVDVIVCDNCGDAESQADIEEFLADDICMDCLEDTYTEQKINEMRGK